MQLCRRRAQQRLRCRSRRRPHCHNADNVEKRCRSPVVVLRVCRCVRNIDCLNGRSEHQPHHLLCNKEEELAKGISSAPIQQHLLRLVSLVTSYSVITYFDFSVIK